MASDGRVADRRPGSSAESRTHALPAFTPQCPTTHRMYRHDTRNRSWPSVNPQLICERSRRTTQVISIHDAFVQPLTGLMASGQTIVKGPRTRGNRIVPAPTSFVFGDGGEHAVSHEFFNVSITRTSNRPESSRIRIGNRGNRATAGET